MARPRLFYRFSLWLLLVFVVRGFVAADAFAADAALPVCSGEPSGPVVEGMATDFEVGDTGIASVELSPGSSNLTLEVDPSFDPGDLVVTFLVDRTVPVATAAGSVVVTDLALQTCTLNVSFVEIAPGVVASEEICAGGGVLLTVSGSPTEPTPGGTSICAASLPAPAAPPLPPGYEFPEAPLSCRVMTVDSPITGDTEMIYVADGMFDPRLRLLFSRFDGLVFPPFADVTETVEPTSSTRMKGRGTWSEVQVVCALQAETCNGLDDDGDGLIDEGLPVGDDSIDADLDGFPLCAPLVGCPLGPFDCVDCNDQIASINPGAPEVLNGLDDNCDGLVDEGFDVNAPLCEANPSGGVVSGTASDQALDDSGIATVALSDDSSDLDLEVDPFLPGDPFVTFQVTRTTPAVEAAGTVVVTDAAARTCAIPINYVEVEEGVPDALTLCSGEGIRLEIDGDPSVPSPGGTSVCAASLPASEAPALPPGYEYSSALEDPSACRVLGVESPISGVLDMTYDKAGDYDASLRLLHSQFGGTGFPPFSDVTETVLPGASTRMKGRGTWSQVRTSCALQAEICNGMDDDGDGLIDEGLPVGEPALDLDLDGFPICPPLTGCLTGPYDCVDCNDQLASVNPGVTEICNGLDDDCDGLIDEGFDADGDDFSTCAGDCDDFDPLIRATPGEVRDVRALHAQTGGLTTLVWTPPAETGGALLVYDVLRSEDPADFVLVADCVEADDGLDTVAFDPLMPLPGAVFHYLLRAENGCPIGEGSLGTTSEGLPRAGRPCL